MISKNILNYRSEQKIESVEQLASTSKGPKLICWLSEQMKAEEAFWSPDQGSEDL